MSRSTCKEAVIMHHQVVLGYSTTTVAQNVDQLWVWWFYPEIREIWDGWWLTHFTLCITRTTAGLSWNPLMIFEPIAQIDIIFPPSLWFSDTYPQLYLFWHFFHISQIPFFALFFFLHRFHYLTTHCPCRPPAPLSTHTQSQAFCVPPHSQRRTEMSRSPLVPSCPPSRSPPWAAGSRVFPRVSGWGSDNLSLVHTVIAQGRLSTLFARRRWEKRATGEMQTPPGNPDATGTEILLPGSILSCQRRLGSQSRRSRRIITLNSHSFGLLWGLTSEQVFFFSHDLGKKGFFFSEEEQQILHLWLWPESYCYHLAVTFGHCTWSIHFYL